jgi:hypothetical protein
VDQAFLSIVRSSVVAVGRGGVRSDAARREGAESIESWAMISVQKTGLEDM